MKRYQACSRAVAIAVTIVALAVVAGCPPSQSPGNAVSEALPPESSAAEKSTIEQIGSTTLLPIATAWAQAYHQVAPDVEVNVAGGGSGTGIEALINGTTDIANASRPMKDSERQAAAEAGVHPVEHVVAYDGLSAIVHPSNPIASLSIQQLSDIYSGEITDWSELGVEGLGKIIVLGRDSSSGTYGSWEEMVVQAVDKNREYTVEMLQLQSNEAVKSQVASTPGAIGYVGLGYIDDSVRAVPIIPLEGGEPVAPSEETIADGSYPISRELYMYTNGEPQGIVKDYLEWGMSEAGQKLVAEVGFVPVK